jgi:hypothetical protein
VVPDAGPLITLAYAGRLELLLALGLKVVVIDMVKFELTRHFTPTSQAILNFIEAHQIEVIETETGRLAQQLGADFKKRHAGERAIQDFLFDFYDEINAEQATQQTSERYALLLFEDHKIAGTGFVLPDNVYVISTQAFLHRLEALKLIPSAQEITGLAVQAGRHHSQRVMDLPPASAPDIKPF